MFKKKKKECLDSIKELTAKTKLIHHPFIKVESEKTMGVMDIVLYINDKNIGNSNYFCSRYETIDECFKFNSNLSKELKDELRPIILKWVEDSKEYYDRKKQIEKDKRNLEIKESNEELLKYIKSL